jgi:hypothetical protein
MFHSTRENATRHEKEEKEAGMSGDSCRPQAASLTVNGLSITVRTMASQEDAGL